MNSGILTCINKHCNKKPYDFDLCDEHYDLYLDWQNEEWCWDVLTDVDVTTQVIYTKHGLAQYVDYKGRAKKICAMCQEEIPVADFSLKVDKRTKIGKILSSYCKNCNSAYSRAKKFGINKFKLAQMFKTANNKCESCGKHTSNLYVDHDHSCCGDISNTNPACGKCIRGLICAGCNTLLGLMEFDSFRLEAALQYLKQHDPNNATVKLLNI